jgi:hypothetical protein
LAHIHPSRHNPEQRDQRACFTPRLVASVRAAKQVRQVTLLSLGRHIDLPRPDWPRLCIRGEALLSAQAVLLAEAMIGAPGNDADQVARGQCNAHNAASGANGRCRRPFGRIPIHFRPSSIVATTR